VLDLGQQTTPIGSGRKHVTHFSISGPQSCLWNGWS